MMFDHPLVIRIRTPVRVPCGGILQALLRFLDPQYKTDTGREVESSGDGWPGYPDVTQAVADAWLRANGFAGRVNKVGPPADSYNCHGFTFTKGNKWVSCDQVKKILDDNGYQRVANPQVGDIVVYRNPGAGCPPDDITHTGKVVAVDNQGPIIESKWGRLGRYRHRPNDVPASYGAPSYYRTNRAGQGGNPHILNQR